MGAGLIDTKRLEDAMEAAKLDQSALARLLDVTPGTINQILTGRTQRSRYMPAIADTLNVSLRWLMKETDERQEKAGPSLSEDERNLLSSWRRLTWDQREAVQRLIESMGPGHTFHSRRQDYRPG